jgi:hypothetical protein
LLINQSSSGIINVIAGCGSSIQKKTTGIGIDFFPLVLLPF